MRNKELGTLPSRALQVFVGWEYTPIDIIVPTVQRILESYDNSGLIMANVPSDMLDMKRAFASHKLLDGVSSASRRSRLMGLFYAAECGLKYLLMRSLNVPSVMDLKPVLKAKYGSADLHDIEKLCMEAAIFPSDVGVAPGGFTVQGTSFASYKVHEAARYGVKLSDSYLVSVETWLRNIAAQVSLRV